jgi:hypothetical protein
MVEIKDLSDFFRDRCPEILFESVEDVSAMMIAVTNTFTNDSQINTLTIFKPENMNGQLSVVKEPTLKGGCYLYGVKDNTALAGYKYTIVYKSLMVNKPVDTFALGFDDLRLLTHWIVEAVRLNHGSA